MERPDITEERLDEILEQAQRLGIMIEMMSYNFQENEIFMIMSIILAKKASDISKDDQQDIKKNVDYVEKWLTKKANSILSKEKNG